LNGSVELSSQLDFDRLFLSASDLFLSHVSEPSAFSNAYLSTSVSYDVFPNSFCHRPLGGLNWTVGAVEILLAGVPIPLAVVRPRSLHFRGVD